MLSPTVLISAITSFSAALSTPLDTRLVSDSLYAAKDFPANLPPAAIFAFGLIDPVSGAVILGGAGVTNLNPTPSTLTYGATTTVDFSVEPNQTLTLTGNVTLASSHLAAGRSKLLRIVASGGIRTTTFPAGWKFIGAAAPASVASGKTALLRLRSWGTADANVTAEYVVEA